MKKFILGFILGACLFSIFPIYAATQTAINVTYNNIKLSVRGELIPTDVEPFVYNNRTFVPARFIAEALGMDVKYNEITDTVEITDKVITGNKNNLLDNSQKYLKTAYDYWGKIKVTGADFPRQGGFYLLSDSDLLLSKTSLCYILWDKDLDIIDDNEDSNYANIVSKNRKNIKGKVKLHKPVEGVHLVSITELITLGLLNFSWELTDSSEYIGYGWHGMLEINVQ